MKQWQAKQEVSGASRQEAGASIKFEFNNSWHSRVFGGWVATLAAAAVN